MHEKEILIFQSLGHPTRLKIIKRLLQGECSVTQLCEVTGEEQHRVSQLLAQLRKSNIVAARRESRQVYYSIYSAPLRNILFDILTAVSAIDTNKAAPWHGIAEESGRFSKIVTREIT